MNDKLNFDAHVQNKISKCNKITGVVKRLSIALQRDALLTFYEMFIRSHLDYADIYIIMSNNLIMSCFVKACLAITGAILRTSQETLSRTWARISKW